MGADKSLNGMGWRQIGTDKMGADKSLDVMGTDKSFHGRDGDRQIVDLHKRTKTLNATNRSMRQ